MGEKKIDERDLVKLDHQEKKDLFGINDLLNFDDDNVISFNYNLDGVFGEKFKDSLNLLDDAKISDGLYWINKNIYFSLWSYKKIKNTNTPNNTATNFIDGGSLFQNYLVEDTIIVNTHSPNFPIVRGYLEKDLDGYFEERDVYLDD